MKRRRFHPLALLSAAFALTAFAAPAGAQLTAEAWQKVVTAAKQEGRVVVSGAPGDLWRDALTVAFQKKYPDIKLEFSAHNGRDFWPKVKKERQVGKYLWDLRIGGPDASTASELAALVPVRPLLLPENADDGAWLGGLNGLFVDKDNRFIPGFLAYAAYPVSVNRDVVADRELSTPEQLLDPKFKGKIVLNDPRGGAGLGYLTVLLQAYGEDYIKRLLTQQAVVVTRDNRQMTEWLVRGRYPIAIGDDSTNLTKFQQTGLGRNVHELKQGPIGLSMGFGGIMFLSQAPHPNAAQVYINWLLSQDGQAQLTRLLQLNSRRLDVPPADPKAAVDAKNLDRYVQHQDYDVAKLRARAKELAAELIH